MTGGVMPAGMDTVVMQEHVQSQAATAITIGGRRIETGREPAPRRRRPEGGTGRAAAGDVLRPAEIGLIASLGIGEVPVYRTLRVAFFSTGDELRSIGTALGAGQVYDSNRYTHPGHAARAWVAR